MFTGKRVSLIVLVAAGLFFAACNETLQPETAALSADSALALSQTDANANSAYLAEAAKPYQGTTIRGISENTPASTYVKDVLAPAFEAETGIKVEMEATSYDRMSSLPIEDMEAGTSI